MVKITAASEQGDGLLARIDEIVILFAGRGRRAHADHAVFAVQDDFCTGRQVVGYQGRQADPEVDHRTFIDVGCHAGRHLVSIPFIHMSIFQAAAFKPAGPVAVRGTCTMRCTNRPGVMTCSGSMLPSSATSCTEAMLTLAAMAMMGPKLRAVLR